MRVKAFEIYNAQSIDGMEWKDILQIVPMGDKAIVLVKSQEGRNNVLETSKNRGIHPLIETYKYEFNRRCKEALYDYFGDTEKITFDYLNSDTSDIGDVIIVYNVEGCLKSFKRLDLRNRQEIYKYITFSQKDDEL